MKILIVRHGDPNYEIDSLTEKGWREAELLSERITKLDVKEFYLSPLGRAKDTASFTLQKLGRTGIECEWLQEFPPKILRPDNPNAPVCWDWLPQDWTKEEAYYQYDNWYNTKIMKDGHVKEAFEHVTSNFDHLLAEYGYVRKGHLYQVEKANNDTIVLFCHFGVGCVIIGHLLGISPMVLWHGFCAAPTSVTTITSEERRKGIACFRVNAYGDTSHLYVHDEEPAFAARFCETYDNKEERHD